MSLRTKITLTLDNNIVTRVKDHDEINISGLANTLLRNFMDQYEKFSVFAIPHAAFKANDSYTGDDDQTKRLPSEQQHTFESLTTELEGEIKRAVEDSITDPREWADEMVVKYMKRAEALDLFTTPEDLTNWIVNKYKKHEAEREKRIEAEEAAQTGPTDIVSQLKDEKRAEEDRT